MAQMKRSASVASVAAPQRVIPGNYWYGYGSCVSHSTSFVGDSFSNHLFDAQYGDETPSQERQPISRAMRAPKERSTKRTYDVQQLVIAILLLLVCLLALSLVLSIASPMVSPAKAEGSLSNTELISVEPGESLWQIAEEHPIEGLTTQQCVHWIMERNDLANSALMVGQVLSVPSAGMRTGAETSCS